MAVAIESQIPGAFQVAHSVAPLAERSQEHAFTRIHLDIGHDRVRHIETAVRAKIEHVWCNQAATAGGHKCAGKCARYSIKPENAVGEVAAALAEVVQPGDLVLTLGAGNIWQAGEELLVYLRDAMHEPIQQREIVGGKRELC